MENDLEEMCRKSGSIEERLEQLRDRNRMLESQLVKEKEHFEMQKKQIQSQMRKQSVAFRTFASLLEEPWLQQTNEEEL